jgi:hypothetical protein
MCVRAKNSDNEGEEFRRFQNKKKFMRDESSKEFNNILV